MTPENILLVQSTFEVLAPDAERFAATFYARLFELEPRLRGMFRGDIADHHEQRRVFRHQAQGPACPRETLRKIPLLDERARGQFVRLAQHDGAWILVDETDGQVHLRAWCRVPQLAERAPLAGIFDLIEDRYGRWTAAEPDRHVELLRRGEGDQQKQGGQKVDCT